MTADNIIHILKYVYIGFVVFDVAVFLWVLKVTKAEEYKAKVYLLLMATIIFWEIVMWLVYFYAGPEDIMIFLDRVSFAFGMFIGYQCLYLLWVLANRSISPVIIYFLGLLSIFYGFASMIPGWITSGRTYTAETTYNFIADPGTYLNHFYILLIVILFLSVYVVFMAIKQSSELDRVRLLYAGFGIVLLLLGGIFTNVILQLYFVLSGTYEVQTGDTKTVVAQLFGVVWTSILGVSLLAAIIRHRYFRIRIAIQKEIAYYTVLFFLAATLLTGTISLYFFYNIEFAIISALLSMGLFIFLQNRIWYWFDALFFLGEIDLSTTQTPKMRSIPSTVHLEKAVYDILMSIAEHATKVDYVYIRQREYNRFISFHPRWEKHTISFDSIILKQFSQEKPTAFFTNICTIFRHFSRRIGLFKKIIYIPIIFDGIPLGIVSFKDTPELKNKDYEAMSKILQEHGASLRSAIDYHEAMAGFAHTWKEKYYS